jgi:hypothetical protein
VCDLRLPRIVDWAPARFAEGGIGFLLRDVDLLARLGALIGTPKAEALLGEILEGMDAEGAFRRDPWIDDAGDRSLYPWFPLEESRRGKHKRYTDVALRIAGIPEDARRVLNVWADVGCIRATFFGKAATCGRAGGLQGADGRVLHGSDPLVHLMLEVAADRSGSVAPPP